MMRFVRDWLRFIWAVLRITPAAASLYILVTVILGVQPAVEFWALQGLTNYVVSHLGPAFGWRVAGGWVALLAGASLLGELGRALIPYLNEWLRQDAERGMEGRLLDRAGRTPLLTLESSDFFNRFTRARDGLRRNIFDVIELTQGIATAIMSVVSVLGVMATTHWGALAALVVVHVTTSASV
jgi:ABC-type multidrug transport system fused ATPase/permease subunit